MPTQPSPSPSLIAGPLLTPDFLRSKFDAGQSFDEHVESGKPEHIQRWREMYSKLALTDAQRTLVASFERQMHVLVSSGTWCGDCIAQCPMLAHIAEANTDTIALRFVDRDTGSEQKRAPLPQPVGEIGGKLDRPGTLQRFADSIPCRQSVATEQIQ